MELPCGGFYRFNALPVSAQECVNLFPNIPEQVTPSKKQLFRPSGIRTVTTAGSNVYNRGSHTFLDKPYFVQGTGLYRVDQTIDGFGVASYSSVLVSGATLLVGNEQVIMADNGQEGGQMMIVLPALNTKFNAYVYDGATLTAVSDMNFDGPVSDVNYIDGYFEFTKADGQIFFVSALRDGTTYSALDYSRAEASPDYNVRSFILRNQLYVWGTQTVQGYQNVGGGASGTGFPFSYIQGSVQSKGLASVYSINNVNDLMVFVGGDHNEVPAIWVTDGGTISKLSTVPIDQAITRYSAETLANCFTWNYSDQGGQFVAFTFPGEQCFVYDFASKEFHTRESVDNMDNTVPCRIASITQAYGVLFIGDSLTNKIGIFDHTLYTEFDDNVPRRFVLPQIDNDGQPFFIDSVEVTGCSGIGLTSGLGSDPVMSLSISRDGGRTFDNPVACSVGAIGEYETRVIWNQQGQVQRECCMKFEMSDPVAWAIQKVEANFD